MLAKPQLAVAANLPAKPPLIIEKIASPNKIAPYFKICALAPFEASASSFIIFVIKNGIKHTQNASTAIKNGVISDGFLYCRTLLSKVFTVLAIFDFSPTVFFLLYYYKL